MKPPLSSRMKTATAGSLAGELTGTGGEVIRVSAQTSPLAPRPHELKRQLRAAELVEAPTSRTQASRQANHMATLPDG
eukprot:8609630-Pyramimonas_sp.AAC.1